MCLMKTFPKLSVFLLSVLFVVSGLFVKQQMGKEGESLPGVVAGQQTNIVSSLYSDIPVYANAAISSILEKNTTVVVSLESGDDPQIIKSFYQNTLESSGWAGGMGGYTKQDKKLSVEVTQNPGKTQTAVVLNYSFVPTK